MPISTRPGTCPFFVYLVKFFFYDRRYRRCIFSPALSSGVSISGLVAQGFHFSATNSNLLILAGMVGFLTGLTRTTLYFGYTDAGND